MLYARGVIPQKIHKSKKNWLKKKNFSSFKSFLKQIFLDLWEIEMTKSMCPYPVHISSKVILNKDIAADCPKTSISSLIWDVTKSVVSTSLNSRRNDILKAISSRTAWEIRTISSTWDKSSPTKTSMLWNFCLRNKSPWTKHTLKAF